MKRTICIILSLVMFLLSMPALGLLSIADTNRAEVTWTAGSAT